MILKSALFFLAQVWCLTAFSDNPAEPVYDLILGAQLVTAPPGIYENVNNVTDDYWKFVRGSVVSYAIKNELLDPREERHFFSSKEGFQGDLDVLRRRNLELAGGPLVKEVNRFPRREYVNEQIRFNRSYRKHLEERKQLEIDRLHKLNEVSYETDYLYKIWDAARDASCGFYYVTVRRQALVKLKELLGPEYYDQGILPPVVPTWRFQEMR